MLTWKLFADLPTWLLPGGLILGAWVGWMAVGWRAARITRPVCIGEQERRRELLRHLRSGQLADVPPSLLLPPRPGSRPLDRRPFVRLVVEYAKARQVFLGALSWFEVVRFLASLGGLWGLFKLLSAFPEIDSVLLWTTVVGMLEHALQPAVASAPWLKLIVEWDLWFVVVVVVLGLVLWLVALILLGRLSWFRYVLILDLNCLYYYKDDGMCHVGWQDVMAVSCHRKRWIRVRLEEGEVLYLCVPQTDRDWLVQTVRQLIRHHHGNLYGQVTIDEQVD